MGAWGHRLVRPVVPAQIRPVDAPPEPGGWLGGLRAALRLAAAGHVRRDCHGS